MLEPMAHPLVRLADGTVLQVGPLTGTHVWTIPGRSHRPLHAPRTASTPLQEPERYRLCPFCPERYLETTPEKARLVRGPHGAHLATHRLASALFDDVADFRRFGNLFEIVSTASWRINHGFIPSAQTTAWAHDYLAQEAGEEHVRAVLEMRQSLGGPVAPARGDRTALLDATVDLLAGSHDVVVARRHLVDGATRLDELASAGTLTPDEHADFLDFTVQALRELYAAQPAARYVSVFQNWLPAAGASVEHLHKQLVAIDSYGPQTQREATMLRSDERLYQHAVVDLAHTERLVVAANDHAVAIVGVGHRYPSLEVYSTSSHHLPWEHTEAERRGMSDLLHALHAATGPLVATNEEWHHRPPELLTPMPWRVVLKWRIQIPAGFEGGTKIYVNTIDPWTMHGRVTAELDALRAAGAIAPVRIGEEVSARDTRLRYAG